MKPRKIILLAGCALLLCICIIQLISSANEKIKMFEFSDSPDELVIENSNGTVNLVKKDDVWLLGDKKYPAADSAVDDMISSLQSIKALDKVGSANSEESLSRYGLIQDKWTKVTAKKAGKELRVLTIGKDAAAGSQSYVTIDGGKDIYLATGNIKGSFSKTVDELRSRGVLNLDKTSITAVSITGADGKEWAVSKSGNGMDINWNISGSDAEIDPELTKNWVESLATFVTPKWHEENEDLGGEKLASAKITCASKVVSFELYKIPAASEDENDIFWGKCSETPYSFELASYAAQKFLKTPEELAK